MNSWYSKFLGDGIWAQTACSEITEKFHLMFMLAGKPIEMAVFIRRESGNLHCEATAYFSPAAGNVAKAFDAHLCVMPERDGLELLAGNGSCWFSLFPENESWYRLNLTKPVFRARVIQNSLAFRLVTRYREIIQCKIFPSNNGLIKIMEVLI